MYKQIIEEILKVYNINASELADKIDVQRSGISHILSGRNKPSIDFILKLKDQFPDIEWNYLMKGEGPMFVTNVNNEDFKNDLLQEEIKQPSLFDLDEKLDIDIPSNKKPHQVQKIVWFYNDHTFEVFYPEN